MCCLRKTRPKVWQQGSLPWVPRLSKKQTFVLGDPKSRRSLLVGIAMSPLVRRALLDAFEEHGLLAYTKPEPEIAVDELGRLRRTQVNEALKAFHENVRSPIISVLEQLHAIA